MVERPAAAESRMTPGGGLAVAAAIVAFGFLGSRLLGILRTVAIADAFGSSPELAAYNVAFRIPDLIFQVLAGATLGSAFIPVFARIYRREGSDEAWKLASNVLTVITLATAVLCVVAWVLAPVLVPLTAPGLGEDVGRRDELVDEAVSLTRLMLLSPLFFAMSGIVTGILNGRQQFFLSALAPIVYNLSIIGGALFLADRWGVKGLAAGVVTGAGLHLAVQVPGLVRERMRFRPVLDLRDAAMREVARLMGPRVVGLAAAQLNFLITTFYASNIDTRAINNLTYAWTIAILPLGLFGMALSTAAFPRLADHAADEDLQSLTATISRVARVIMFLTIPAAVGLLLLRDPVTIVLLQHGEFVPADGKVVAAALAFYCLAIVPMAGIEIHSRGFYALGDTTTPVGLAVFAVGLNLFLSALLSVEFKHEGLAFALAASAWVEWAALWALYVRRTGASPWPDLWPFARFTFCAAMMAAVLAVAMRLFEAPTGGQLNAWTIALAGAMAGAAVYAGMARWLRIEEFQESLARVTARFGRRS